MSAAPSLRKPLQELNVYFVVILQTQGVKQLVENAGKGKEKHQCLCLTTHRFNKIAQHPV